MYVCIAKVNALETLLDDSALTSGRGAAHDPSLVVEVTQDNEYSSSLRSKSVLNRDLNVVESDEGSTSCGRVAGLDLTGFDTFTTLNEHDSEAILSLASDGEADRGVKYQIKLERVPSSHSLVCERSIRDPLLGAVHYPMLSILSLDSIGLETKHVTSGLCLRDGQADELLAGKNFRHNLGLEIGVAEVENGGKTDDFTTKETITIATSTATYEFLSDD